MGKPRKKTQVFVSYSRHDEALVRPLAGLLGVPANGAVFLDVTSIPPGAKWQSEIESALGESSVVVVCWCCEAEKSEFVAHEIALAVDAKDKRLVPVLFCETPLPPDLDGYQWIDLRGHVKHTCAHPPAVTPPRKITARRRSSRSPNSGVLGGVLAGAAGVGLVYGIHPASIAHLTRFPSGAVGEVEPFVWTGWLLHHRPVLILAVAALIVLACWLIAQEISDRRKNALAERSRAYFESLKR